MNPLAAAERVEAFCARESSPDAESLGTLLEELGLLVPDYGPFLLTSPIDVNRELFRLSGARLDLTCALLTMLLREDCFCEGAFETRLRRGEIALALNHLCDELYRAAGRRRRPVSAFPAVGFPRRRSSQTKKR